MSLENQVAIVTGAGRGIGRAIAVALAKEGTDVVIASMIPAEMKITEQEMKKFGSRALVIKTDVGKNFDVKNMVKQTLKEFGRIDILVNNAGVAYRRLFQETTEKEFEHMVDVNIRGVFLC
ncbi:MAG TPA: SDR family NAD(P)-dependent oxidoreductase, partial [Candidatus Nanoarchaeia archaeon]|nr:SDR family NAD(P)-dependent oxidoreductase [Candidatus Nanoarchaeia archaeon]